MATKDTKLEEKNEYVVHGTVYADAFKFRETGKDVANSGVDEWVETMKQYVIYDEDNNEVQCGVHFYCDGDLETDSDIVCGRDLCIDSLQNIQDPNGDPFIPNPSGHLKEALVHNTTGYAWYKGYELAGFQVVAKSVFEGGSFVYQTHIVYFVWNDTAGASYGEVYVRYYEQ